MADILRVFHFNRCAGCDPRLIDFLVWWQTHGPFPVTIPQTGGIRNSEAEQMRLYVSKKSKARSLAETPHGRGGAIDAYPAILDPTGTYVANIHLDVKNQQSRELFQRFGVLARDHGLEWGGDFKPLDAHGIGWDCPHIQVPDWKELPYPLHLRSVHV